MNALAVLSPTLRLEGALEQWRRTTGVLRGDLAAHPIWAFIHPDDIWGFRLMLHMPAAHWVRFVVRMGYFGKRVPVRLELGPVGPDGRRYVVAEALSTIPVASWWLTEEAYAATPAMPKRLEA